MLFADEDPAYGGGGGVPGRRDRMNRLIDETSEHCTTPNGEGGAEARVGFIGPPRRAVSQSSHMQEKLSAAVLEVMPGVLLCPRQGGST